MSLLQEIGNQSGFQLHLSDLSNCKKVLEEICKNNRNIVFSQLWFVEEIFAVPNHWMFNMGVVVAFIGALAYVVRVYARLVELGAETPGENPYVAEMYKMALEGKLYSRAIP